MIMNIQSLSHNTLLYKIIVVYRVKVFLSVLELVTETWAHLLNCLLEI